MVDVSAKCNYDYSYVYLTLFLYFQSRNRIKPKSVGCNHTIHLFGSSCFCIRVGLCERPPYLKCDGRIRKGARGRFWHKANISNWTWVREIKLPCESLLNKDDHNFARVFGVIFTARLNNTFRHFQNDIHIWYSQQTNCEVMSIFTKIVIRIRRKCAGYICAQSHCRSVTDAKIFSNDLHNTSQPTQCAKNQTTETVRSSRPTVERRRRTISPRSVECTFSWHRLRGAHWDKLVWSKQDEKKNSRKKWARSLFFLHIVFKQWLKNTSKQRKFIHIFGGFIKCWFSILP